MDELSEDSLRRPKLNALSWEALGSKEFLETCPVEREVPAIALCRLGPGRDVSWQGHVLRRDDVTGKART